MGPVSMSDWEEGECCVSRNSGSEGLVPRGVTQLGQGREQQCGPCLGQVGRRGTSREPGGQEEVAERGGISQDETGEQNKREQKGWWGTRVKIKAAGAEPRSVR